MVVDTDGEVCITAGFNFGVGSFTREYEIRVQQYDRRNALGGPPGCLQFYVRTTARVVTFNWNENEDIQTGTRNFFLKNFLDDESSSLVPLFFFCLVVVA